MAPPPTVIGTQGYRRGLASFLLSKTFIRVHRNVPGKLRRSRRDNRIGTLSGGTVLVRFYLFRVCIYDPETRRELAFQLCLPQLALSFCFVV